MARIILKLINIPGLIFFLSLAVAIQTSFFNFWPMTYFQPDAALIFVIWCALKRKFIEGGILTLVFAHIGELHSSAPQGIFLLAYVLIFLWIRLLARWVALPSLNSVILLAVISGILWKGLIAIALRMLAGHEFSWLLMATYLVPGAVAEAFLANFGFRFLEKWDWISFKTRRADHEDYEKLEYDEWQTWNELVQDEFRTVENG